MAAADRSDGSQPRLTEGSKDRRCARDKRRLPTRQWRPQAVMEALQEINWAIGARLRKSATCAHLRPKAMHPKDQIRLHTWQTFNITVRVVNRQLATDVTTLLVLANSNVTAAPPCQENR